MTYLVDSDDTYPLAALVERVSKSLKQRVADSMARGGTLDGDGWRIVGTRLAVQRTVGTRSSFPSLRSTRRRFLEGGAACGGEASSAIHKGKSQLEKRQGARLATERLSIRPARRIELPRRVRSCGFRTGASVIRAPGCRHCALQALSRSDCRRSAPLTLCRHHLMHLRSAMS